MHCLRTQGISNFHIFALTLVSIMVSLDRPLKTRRVYLLNNGLRVARHHQGTAPG